MYFDSAWYPELRKQSGLISTRGRKLPQLVTSYTYSVDGRPVVRCALRQSERLKLFGCAWRFVMYTDRHVITTFGRSAQNIDYYNSSKHHVNIWFFNITIIGCIYRFCNSVQPTRRTGFQAVSTFDCK